MRWGRWKWTARQTEVPDTSTVPDTTEAASALWRGVSFEDRMATVDRNVLRSAVAELMSFPSTPRAVVINEALEIARKFSSPESVNFINGVLDSVGRELEKA